MKLKTLLLVLGIACLVPAGASASTFRGIVIGKQHGRLLVATPSGAVKLVAAHASIGARLVGTRVVGHASRAHLHGIVVKRIGTTMFLSSNRHLVALKTGRVLSATTPTTPTPGSVVDATVKVDDDGELEVEDEDEVGHVSGNIPIQATISAVGAGTVTLTVNGQSVTVNLPNGLTLPASLIGQTVTLNVSLKDDDDQGEDDDDDDGGHSGHGGGGDD